MFALFVLGFVLFPARPGYASFASFFFKSAGADEIEHVPADENVQTLDVLDANLPPKPDDMPKDISPTQIEDDALLPEVGPMGTIADIEDFEDAPGPDQISLYRVRSGDSIASIAKMFGVTEGTIRSANGIPKGTSIDVGEQILILPISGVKHKVVKGDTVASVAKKYSGDVDEIILYNDLSDGALVVGDEIIIPNGEIAEAAVKSKSSTTSSTAKKSVSTAPVSTSGYIRPVKGIVTQWAHDQYRAVDIGAPTGTSVYAARGGKVIAAKTGWSGGYGNMIIIDHGNGVQTLYAHLSKLDVSFGQTVDQGQLIGRVGSTGHSTGSHLHFEARGMTGLPTSLYQGAPSVAKKK